MKMAKLKYEIKGISDNHGCVMSEKYSNLKTATSDFKWLFGISEDNGLIEDYTTQTLGLSEDITIHNIELWNLETNEIINEFGFGLH